MVDKNKQIIALKAFASDGNVPKAGEDALCQVIDKGMLHLLQSSLPESLRLSQKLIKKSTTHAKRVRFECQRALARATHMSGKYDDAKKAYLAARKLTEDWDQKARIDRAMIDVYMYLGDYGSSKRRRNLAISTFRKLRKEAEVAKTEVNYANVLHRQDRHKDAEKLYRQAAALFISGGDGLSAARCLYNRANTLVQLFAFNAAEEDYARSAELYFEHGFEKDATDAEWGLAWMHMLKGNFHFALKKLNACEEVYRRIGVPMRVASCELDRAEVFLQLNLFEDALDSAQRAEKMFRRLKVRYEAAKAALFGAYAALATGQNRRALSSVRRAKAGFLHDDNTGFLGAAELLEAKAAVRDHDRNKLLKRAGQRFKDDQLLLWQAICDINSLQSKEMAKKALDRLKSNPAVSEIPSIYSAFHVAQGDNEAANGNTSAAVHHWRSAADRLDAVRSALPPIELQSAFGKDIRNPHRRLIRTFATTDTLDAAVWSERHKTSGLWAPTPQTADAVAERNKVSRNLRELSQYVLSLSRQVGSPDSRLSMTTANERDLNKLRKQIRQSFIDLEHENKGHSEDHHSIADQFREISNATPIVQYHIGSTEIICFVHHKGESRVHVISDGPNRLQSLAAKWSFLLESAALSGDRFDAKDQAKEQRIFNELGEVLWVPLEIDSGCKRVLVIPEGQLASLPWAAIKPNGCAMVDRHQIILCPSLRHYIRANLVEVSSPEVSIFVGDTAGLNHADSEKEMVADNFSGRSEVFDPCRRDSWPEEGDWNIWHYTGHAMLNVRNPFYSSLSLADGALFAADLRLRQVNLNLATIAACHSGTEVALPGEESTGFVRSFLEMGARNVLAGHWSVSDSSAVIWMGRFYKELLSGKTISEAAQIATIDVKEKYRSAYYWAVFSVFGAGL